MAGDGSHAMFGCYNATPGSLTFESTAARVIARLFVNGTIDTSLYASDLTFPNVFVSVLLRDLVVYLRRHPSAASVGAIVRGLRDGLRRR